MPDPAPGPPPASGPPPATLTPWLGVTAVAALALTATSAAGRAIGASALLAAAGFAAFLHWRNERRRAAEVAGLAENLRTASRPPADLSGRSAEPGLHAAAAAVADRAARHGAALVAVTEERDRLFAVLEGMGEGVVAVGRDERVIAVNRSAASLLRVDAARATGRPVWEVVRRSAVRDACEAVLEGAVRYDCEFPGPADATLSLRADPLPGVGPGGAAAGVVVQLRDVTELRRLENVRRDFTANVSHELKTPVAAISAMAETLCDTLPSDPPHLGRFAGEIGAQADRLHRLIVDILRLGRVETGRETFDVGRVAVGPVVAGCVERHRAAADVAGVRLSEAGPPGGAFVFADADALGTVLDNLLDNALAHTPAGGRITVAWDAPDAAGAPVRIAVADTGAGIPEEHRARVFERFHRVDPDRSRDRGGTGLGLAIVKHLAQLFGGTVRVESEVGRGSTFTVELPAA